MPDCMCGAQEAWSKNNEKYYESFVKKILRKHRCAENRVAELEL